MNRRRISSPRLLAATVAVLATSVVAVPAAANAVSAEKGVSFGLAFTEVLRKDGEISKIKDFTFSGMPITCNEGSGTYTPSKPLPGMKLDGRDFKGKFTHKGVTTKVTGRYKRNFEKVKGTLKVKGDIGSFHDCKSEKFTWKAS